jgi:hypothetical protein
MIKFFQIKRVLPGVSSDFACAFMASRFYIYIEFVVGEAEALLSNLLTLYHCIHKNT